MRALFLTQQSFDMVWYKLSGLMFHERTFPIITFSLIILFWARGSFVIHGAVGNTIVWTSVCQCAIALLILGVQFVAKERAQQGKVSAARVLLVPLFESLLWSFLILTLVSLLIFTSGSPAYPHFIEAFYVSTGRYHANEFTSIFIFITIDDLTLWSVYFLFVENSLCLTALIRACKRSVCVSVLFTLVEMLGYLVRVHAELDWAVALFSGFVRVVEVVAYVFLGIKAYRSSRHSALPFAVMTCALTALEIVPIFILSSRHKGKNILDSPVLVGLDVAHKLLFNLCLYWTLHLDTKYWRGVTRIPVWCAGSDCSPYDQLSDHVIQRDIPLLISGPSLAFIDFAFLKIGSVIGTGATCRVYTGHVCIGPLKGKAVAIKVFTPLEISSETLSDFANEIHKFERLQHPRVMQLIGVCVRPPDVCMVCELCEGGSLYQLLHSRTLDPHEKLRLSIQVCEAVSFIHSLSPPVIHRDLKSLNFLVTSSGDLKLSDFGTSKNFVGARSRSMTKTIGSLQWMSPEVLSGSDAYDLKADVYSLGIVLWEIWSQDDPYTNVNSSKLVSHIVSGLRPTIPETCPSAIAGLISSMCNHAPALRPRADNVLACLLQLQYSPNPKQNNSNNSNNTRGTLVCNKAISPAPGLGHKSVVKF